MKAIIEKMIDAGATGWHDCSDDETREIISAWLSDPSNIPEIGEGIAHDGIILWELLKVAYDDSEIQGARRYRLARLRAAAVGACVMDIVHRLVMSEAKHIFKEVQWGREGV